MVPCGTESLPAPAVAAIEAAMRRTSNVSQNFQLKHVHPRLLFLLDGSSNAGLQPDSTAQFELGDRVVCAHYGGSVPLRAHGTVVTVYGGVVGEVEVVFDEPVPGGGSLGGRCTELYGIALPRAWLINLSHGLRVGGLAAAGSAQPQSVPWAPPGPAQPVLRLQSRAQDATSAPNNMLAPTPASNPMDFVMQRLASGAAAPMQAAVAQAAAPPSASMVVVPQLSVQVPASVPAAVAKPISQPSAPMIASKPQAPDPTAIPAPRASLLRFNSTGQPRVPEGPQAQGFKGRPAPVAVQEPAAGDASEYSQMWHELMQAKAAKPDGKSNPKVK